jgi:beta-glucuronidase
LFDPAAPSDTGIMRKVVLASLVVTCGALAGIPPAPLPPARLQYDDGQDPIGNRTFRTTTLRHQIPLAGDWDFAIDPDDRGRAEVWFTRFPEGAGAIAVPGSWNTHARYWAYIGAAWYRRTFDLPRAGNLLLHFRGVFYDAEVWLDGKPLGRHEGGYLRFEFLVPAAAGRHTLTVRAANRTTATTIPQKNVDWFPYGGIHRPVYAELVPAASIRRLNVSGGPAGARVQAVIRSDAASKKRIALFLDGREVYAHDHQLQPGDTTLDFTVPIANPRIWSPDAPHLYSARLLLGDDDDQFTRFGFRTISVDGPRILVNGKRFLMLGANRHEDHPEWGPAVPAHLTRRDVELIKALGANTVRSHYPPSELFLDYCDQAGLFVMNEVPAWQTPAAQLADPAVRQKMKEQFRAMVERDLGHPSILTWSLGNEWPAIDKSLDAVRELAAYARSIDRTHPLTLITVNYAGPAHDVLDIISTNWGLHEWYDDAHALDPSQIAPNTARLDRIHARSPNKPIVLSEFGGAEAQLGWHNWASAKWSEEYQAGNVEGSARFGLEHDWMSGGCVWQFSDSRTAPERILSARLHGWNSKGVVDAFRQPKQAFYALQALYRRFTH